MEIKVLNEEEKSVIRKMLDCVGKIDGWGFWGGPFSLGFLISLITVLLYVVHVIISNANKVQAALANDSFWTMLLGLLIVVAVIFALSLALGAAIYFLFFRKRLAIKKQELRTNIFSSNGEAAIAKLKLFIEMADDFKELYLNPEIPNARDRRLDKLIKFWINS